jgi:hypothetical protein
MDTTSYKKLKYATINMLRLYFNQIKNIILKYKIYKIKNLNGH